MKTLTGLFVLIAIFTIDFKADAQAQRLTRRIVNPDHTLKTPNAPSAPAASQVIPSAPTPTQPPQAVVVPEKTAEQKAELLRKTIEFQKTRAESGAPSAQYDLGMRYLTGDGVEKDSVLAKKWLNASATNGNSQAVKKLEELRKKEPITK